MPESPEIAVYVDWLREQLTPNQFAQTRLVAIHIKPGSRFSRHVRDSDKIVDINTRILPQQITGIHTHGKFLWITLGCLGAVGFTHGMTGGWASRPSKATRLIFEYEADTVAANRRLYFNDSRNFATVSWFPPDKLSRKLDSLGIDPLLDSLTGADLAAASVHHPTWTLAQLLMSQQYVAGVGAYIKCEALYRSGLSPHRELSNCSGQNFDSLAKHISAIMKESYAVGGASFLTYKAPGGQRQTFADCFNVYRRKIDLAGNEVIREATKDGRFTYWSPAAQR